MACSLYAFRPFCRFLTKTNARTLSFIQPRPFSQSTFFLRPIIGASSRYFSTEVDRAEIEKRVLNVCKAYDRINADKVSLESHFKNDLGLDSLDHIEVIMEVENEFGLEIPDVEAEKLMKPSDIVEMLYTKKVRKVKLD